MAVTVIGGLITSTVLSLLVVPVVFTYVDDFAQWLERRRAARPLAADSLRSPPFIPPRDFVD
jgi:hypothetical protein